MLKSRYQRTIDFLKRPLKGWRRAPGRCWLTELPTELRATLLMAVIEQETSAEMPSFWTLVLNFTEFGQLAIVVDDSVGLDVPAPLAHGLLEIRPDQWPLCPRAETARRPVRLFLKTKEYWGSKTWPWDLLNFQKTPPLKGPIGWASCTLDADRLGPRTLEYPYPGFIPKAFRAGLDDQQIVVDYGALDNWDRFLAHFERNGRRITFYRQSVDESWTLKWPFDPHVHHMKLLVERCTEFQMTFPNHNVYQCLTFLSINMVDNNILPDKAPLVVLPFFPEDMLHISFSSRLVPDLVADFGTLGRWPGNSSMFTLENTNWSSTNPYGYPDHSTSGTDQATACYLHRNHRLRVEQIETPIPVAYRNYPIVKLYGVPDATFYGTAPRANVPNYRWRARCLYWWRLTPRRATPEMELPKICINAPRLRELYLTSVVHAHRPVPCFNAPWLEKLVLISLDNSDVPWNLRYLLAGAGQTPMLTSVHLEKRTHQPYSDFMPQVPIKKQDLKAVADTVERLHVRGHVPLFVVPHGMKSCGAVKFPHLYHIMIDISLVGQCHKWIPPNCQNGPLEMALSDEEYPTLKTITLMCSREAHALKMLKKADIDLQVPVSCQEVNISTLVKTECFSINGLVISSATCLGPEVEEPMVTSRRCFRWRRNQAKHTRHFYCSEQFNLCSDWLSDIGEY